MAGLRGFTYEKIYPEIMAGGFARHDDEFLFFSRLRILLKSTDTVLDLGAGRGYSVTSGPLGKIGYKRLDLLCKKLIGADVDEAVRENPYLAESHVIGEDGHVPVEDASCDMVMSRSVMEHVENPEIFASEVERMLKPGGWFCALTPNKWGYGSIGARLVPNKLHAKVLRSVGAVGRDGGREDEDVFPTVFRINTRRDIERVFSKEKFEHGTYYHGGPPAYTGGYWPLAAAFLTWEWIMPRSFLRNIHVFIRKRGAHA